MHHYNSTQYCKTETVFSMFPFLQTNITSQMWPSGSKGGSIIQYKNIQMDRQTDGRTDGPSTHDGVGRAVHSVARQNFFCLCKQKSPFNLWKDFNAKLLRGFALNPTAAFQSHDEPPSLRSLDVKLLTRLTLLQETAPPLLECCLDGLKL